MFSSIDAKLLAIAGVSIGSYIFGCIPAVVGLGSRCKESVLMSSTLCFGAGVLLSTSVVHILPDVRNDVHKWGEILLCVGFFAIYFIDVMLSSCQFDDKTSSEEHDSLINQEDITHYGSIVSENEPSVSFYQDNSLNRKVTKQRSCMNFGLLVAFTTHALLEGLVIGIQDTTTKVFMLLAAVCSHKLLVAFCLGAELISDGQPWHSLIFPLSVFVLGSDLGIIFGMIFEIDSSPTTRTAIPYIQGIAGGTLLYIALCEIIPREKLRKLPRYAGIFQIIGMFSGFLIMTSFSILM